MQTRCSPTPSAVWKCLLVHQAEKNGTFDSQINQNFRLLIYGLVSCQSSVIRWSKCTLNKLWGTLAYLEGKTYILETARSALARSLQPCITEMYILLCSMQLVHNALTFNKLCFSHVLSFPSYKFNTLPPCLLKVSNRTEPQCQEKDTHPCAVVSAPVSLHHCYLFGSVSDMFLVFYCSDPTCFWERMGQVEE